MKFDRYLELLRPLAAEQGIELQLRPGVSESALADVEQKLGFQLDKPMRQAWLTHNGGEEWQNTFAIPDLTDGYTLLSLGQAMAAREHLKTRSTQYDNYQQPKRRDKRIQKGWYHPGWVPFAGFGGGTLLLMQDYSPAPTGVAGQIIAFTHDPDAITYVADGFASFLRESINALKSDPEEFFPEE